MSLPMPTRGADFEMCPEGSHVAVCYRVIDLGTQDTTYLGAAKRKHLILISWELPHEPMNDGRPFTISKRYTYSSDPKANLRKDLESWRGQAFTDADLGEFDIGRLVGVGCMINVMHAEKGEKTYTNVTAIMRLPKGTKAPELFNPRLCLSLSDRPFDYAGFDTLSDGLKDMIRKAPEYVAAVEGRDPSGVAGEEPPPPTGEGDYGARYDDDPIPF